MHDFYVHNLWQDLYDHVFWKLEVVGLYPLQVEGYLCQEADLSQSQKLQISTFLRNRPVVPSLARIPIQLDAVCFVWGMGRLQCNFMTMTTLYRAASDCLWRKDIVQLDRKMDGEFAPPQQVQMCMNVRPLVLNKASCLEPLSFTGLYHGLVDLDLGSINAGLPDLNFSLNRTSLQILLSSLTRDSLTAARQTYHFIHLTCQEYFAA